MEALITYELGTPIWSTVTQGERVGENERLRRGFLAHRRSLSMGVNPSTVSVQVGQCEPRYVCVLLLRLP